MRLQHPGWLRDQGFIQLFSQIVSIQLYPYSGELAFVPCFVCDSGVRDHLLVANRDICRFLLKLAAQPMFDNMRVVAIRAFGLQLALTVLVSEDSLEV